MMRVIVVVIVMLAHAGYVAELRRFRKPYERETALRPCRRRSRWL